MIMGMQTPVRRPTRLEVFDYTASGAYFITLVAHHRARLFGKVVNGEMLLNRWGSLIETEWRKLADRFLGVEVDIYVVMPNHFHAIICLPDLLFHVGARPDPSTFSTNPHCASPGDANLVGPLARARLHDGSPSSLTDLASPLQSDDDFGLIKPRALGTVVGSFKSTTTRLINRLRRTPGQPVWQRNYYEHIIRGERDWDAAAGYIESNPSNWDLDDENR